MGINIKDNKNLKDDKELSYEILKSLNIDANDVNNEEVKSSEVKVKNKRTYLFAFNYFSGFWCLFRY
jgi:hypothetical protein